ncbi:pyruvate, phosphate dikinase [Phytophthora cinnamomi]|uniref:pyruvate, phosphate dikinase n=1 Tax=Phytophthora cinnamomi TaxID=4785 RepID=UPI00355A235E|nr:pyruvate, phosphate dikinase [Phytophthora cinnamomi]KAG6609705.1 pyruvate, phosphate dikinase [Phytophthora cinnamomi]KAG6609707.1 pyruvate, phosphate dikinase [Phytophthora cinnamomi]KAG6609708.1 pyruvate, phosphate dikinase [Phytophthora cinnamomi]KAG6610066.1 pyruvate, phosphate dikinase [Phytophthora cinnamomi]
MSQVLQHPRVFTFVKGESKGNGSMKPLLGGKGANLCQMARNGVNVPPGLTITTEVCQEFYAVGGRLPDGLMDEVRKGVHLMEKTLGVTFADATNPLLVSVRSGAAISMPGMMDTVLNLGLNDEIVKGVAKRGGERFAFDCYRRLLQMFGDVVLEIPHDDFEAELSAMKQARHVTFDVELTASDLKELVHKYKKVYEKHGRSFPSDPWEQMRMGIEAVFRSWNIPRAVKYREINKITGLKGTAVNVQAMVYGNINDQSCTGVLFTRNPANGENKLYGEFLLNAQGEDVVAGIRTPQPISELAQKMPTVYKQLDETVHTLETHFKDVQDTEFTVQDGVLFMLQTRNGKRTGPAALKIAVDMWREKLITEEEAVMLVEPRHLDQLLHPSFANEKGYQKDVLCRGLPASPGAAVGKIVFTAADAEAWFARGENVMLVREETSPEDVGGMHAAEGILTSRGGMTSHAAVVARGWGKPCVCGCSALSIDANSKTMRVHTASGAEVVLREGDYISVNGTTGEVIKGEQELQKAAMSGDLAQFMKWVDAHRRMEVFTNADTPEDAREARAHGAQGIGLTRTEHMFFSSAQRIAAVRRMIGAVELDSPAQQEALDALCTFQQGDFEGIFRAMDGLPVTIRMLDPPLHEFLPHEGSALEELCETLAKEMKVSKATVQSRLAGLKEANPMMGLRGCRLGIVHPGITEMQAKAIAEAAVKVAGEGISVHPHIMIPLVGSFEELEQQVKLVKSVVQDVIGKRGKSFDYKVGTMIEVPRGALQAGKLAEVAEFFSFGTNDLTQMTFGISRDDAQAKFLSYYVKHGVLEKDPFETLDQEGVGELVRLAVERGRATRPKIELGICGEHGGDPQSIEFFEKVGLKYVSCSPMRVMIARLAAAQAALKLKKSSPVSGA